eukprot:5060780-Prymnesium_polylepis.1
MSHTGRRAVSVARMALDSDSSADAPSEPAPSTDDTIGFVSTVDEKQAPMAAVARSRLVSMRETA